MMVTGDAYGDNGGSGGDSIDVNAFVIRLHIRFGELVLF